MGLRRGCCGLLLCWLALAQTPVQLTKITGGFSQPTHVTSARDGSGRLFVVEQAGRIRIVRNGTTATTFLDISARVSCCGERGLLSVAFPPDFAARKHFYVYYTDSSGDITISRFGLTDTDHADAASETVLLTIPHRQYANHNGGQLSFGPDSYLYIGTGDGGGGGDPLGNGQNTGALLAKILRIDVESGGTPYAIPPGNPFATTSGARPEIWAYGLRNPWRFSFDRQNGDLYIADVGQGMYEEIDYQPASSHGGENYGWNRTEGRHCYQGACSMDGITMPIAEYDHSGGACSVTGGYVYRGARAPSLTGTYFYADYCTGQIWGLKRTGSTWSSTQLLASGLNVTSFGEDEAGELYLLDQGHGDLYRIDAPASAASIAAIVNAASFVPGVAPGALATLFGQGIAPSGITGVSSFPLPTSLAGVSLEVNGVAVPLLAVANVNGLEQINFQVPYETNSGTTVTVMVRRGGSVSPPFPIVTAETAPALFTFDGTHAAAQHGASFAPISAANAAAAGEVIVLYGTGLGPLDHTPVTGAAAPLDPLARTVANPTVTIGGLSAAVEFSGLTPFSVGVNQINVRVPDGLAAGEQPVVVTAGGRSSPPVRINVR